MFLIIIFFNFLCLDDNFTLFISDFVLYAFSPRLNLIPLPPLLFNWVNYLVFWRRWWHPTPVLLPGKFHGWRSLVGCSPWDRKESDTTEWLHFHFSLSYIGEGNGNPLQCSCLENSRDRGAWWATVYGVTQSRTRLKWFSSSSSSIQNLLLRMAVWYKINSNDIFHRKRMAILKSLWNHNQPK